ncbi:hypothetical protein MAR_019886 [Mya arenaria]|uniref:Uncharacterized protein n=1 Tax=Mya arenaria TaxID=6604 RepID=A0ABY7E6D5_MYAAR|nr:hypothetical protein MAR_019886 [Mya arenaria]
MAEEIINIRRQLGEKNKQLETRDGEIKELNKKIKGFTENVNNDIQFCKEAKTTDETELNHTDVAKEKQTNETTVSAQINSQNEYDTKDGAVYIQSLDSSNNAPENIVNISEKVLSGDCDGNALENAANNDAEESRDNAENEHRRGICKNDAEESKDDVMHTDSGDILNNSALSDESSNNPTDKFSVEESGSGVEIENISAPVADVSDSWGQNALNRVKLDPPSASCGLPDQQDERNTPDNTRMNNGNQDKEEHIKNGHKRDDVLPTDMTTCHLKMEIYNEKYTNSNTLPSQSEEQL